MKQFICLLLLAASLRAETQTTPPGVGVTDHRKEKIPLSTVFRDETGRERTLREFFDGRRPVILAPAYYNCPRLCTYVYNGLRDSIASNITGGLIPGQDYQIVSFSFNPDDKPQIAAKKGENYRASVQTGKVDSTAWPFLTGTQESILALTGAIGFNFHKDGNDYSHPSTIVILTPDGTISRYMYGIEFDPRVLRLSLVEASAGRIGSPSDSLMLFCFRFDDQTGRYTPSAWAFMRIMAATILLTLLILIFFMLKGEKSQRNR